MKAEATPLVSVVNVTWNGRDLLEKHLPSLKNLSYPNYEVIVVDNGSSDGSVDFIRQNYPEFRVIENRSNLGTAEGSNVAISEAKGKYIFWVSNDMELDSSILDHLMARFRTDSKIGICTVKMLRIRDGKLIREIDSVGADLDMFGFPASRGINEADDGQYDHATDVFFSFGGAMMIRKDVLDLVGGYDPDYLTLADDIDLSWRVRLAGFRVVVEPKAYLYHRVSATLSSSHSRAEKRFISERNTLRTLLKNYSFPSLVFILPVYLTLLFMEMVFFFAAGRAIIAKAGIRALAWNLEKLGTTLKRRKRIQAFRKVGDVSLLGLMLKSPQKITIFFDFMKNRKSAAWRGYFG